MATLNVINQIVELATTVHKLFLLIFRSESCNDVLQICWKLKFDIFLVNIILSRLLCVWEVSCGSRNKHHRNNSILGFEWASAQVNVSSLQASTRFLTTAFVANFNAITRWLLSWYCRIVNDRLRFFFSYFFVFFQIFDAHLVVEMKKKTNYR